MYLYSCKFIKVDSVVLCLPVPTGTTAAATTYDYGYAARTAQTAYDTSKTYYQQPTAAAAAAAAATYSTTDYQGKYK